MMTRYGVLHVVLSAIFGLTVLFLILPLVFLVPISLTASQFLEFPPQSLSLRWYAEFFNNPTWMRATRVSLTVGIGATSLALVAGTLASVALVRAEFRGKGLLTALLIAPLIIPTVIIALSLYIVFLRWRLVDNLLALTLVHALVAMPYVVLIVSAALRRFDTTLERAARVLGAGPIRAFFSVTLPYLLPAMLAASILAFFASFDELIITLFVSGGTETLPVRIWNDLTLRLDPTVPAVSVMLTVLSIGFMAIGEVFRRRHQARYPTEHSTEK
jgi:putative spermidine/putrescine transport system permease protein